VRKLLALLVIVLGISCNNTDNPVIAEAFHNKLYFSEVSAKIPAAISKEDSLLLMEQYVDEWILHQTLLNYAKKELSQKEQNFDSQIKQYKEQLLIDAYFKKISEKMAQFTVSKEELADFLNETTSDETPEYREMVKLNYIKLSNTSKVYKKIKELFFKEEDRVKNLQQLETLCADTIEYYLDSEHWFYTDFIERELPFSFSDKTTNNNDKLDFEEDGYRYLVFILDRKQQLQPKNILEDKKMAQLLLQQQKRAVFIANYQDSIVRKSLLNKSIIKFSVIF